MQAKGVAVPSCRDLEGGNAVLLCFMQVLQSLSTRRRRAGARRALKIIVMTVVRNSDGDSGKEANRVVAMRTPVNV